ncbi:MAG: helix-turn-helix transcriptional regulator [Gammaproteobacteria bacterium]|nr:helix-turn-helix transcriptional regulator [Gammaproteobacteria bacterium]
MNINTKSLRKLRVDKGWTQQHLADLTGLSLRTIQRVEKTGQTSMETVSAFCSVFEIERNELVLIPDLSIEELKPAKQYNLVLLSISVFIIGVVVGVIVTLFINS